MKICLVSVEGTVTSEDLGIGESIILKLIFGKFYVVVGLDFSGSGWATLTDTYEDT